MWHNTLDTTLVLFLAAAAFAIGFWWQSDKIKRMTVAYARRYCRQRGLQLLDQTTVLRGIWLGRGEDGWPAVGRRYQFEFSTTGEHRYRGDISLLGTKLVAVETEAHIIPPD